MQLSKDIWIAILEYLSPIEILKIKTTSKLIYRAYKNEIINKRVRGGMKKSYCLSINDWKYSNNLIKELHTVLDENICYTHSTHRTCMSITDNKNNKTITILTALRYIKDGKIFIVVHHKNIAAWTKILYKFDVPSFVFYSTNKQYKPAMCSNVDKMNHKIILTSVRIYEKIETVNLNKDFLIFDEGVDHRQSIEFLANF